jgi:hypothetical protein
MPFRLHGFDGCFQLVIGDHLARSVRGVPCSPPFGD